MKYQEGKGNGKKVEELKWKKKKVRLSVTNKYVTEKRKKCVKERV